MKDMIEKLTVEIEKEQKYEKGAQMMLKMSKNREHAKNVQQQLEASQITISKLQASIASLHKQLEEVSNSEEGYSDKVFTFIISNY
jgi:septal ring factor EnvC (AmiA/AmiB activator)